MLFNRKIQIDLVKGSPEDDDEPTLGDFLDAAKIAERQEAIRNLAMFTGVQVIKGVAVYVTLDTIRKIAVSRLSK